jgi:hypothetical protein
MTHKRLATVAFAGAVLGFAAPALAGNGGATPTQVEQLGPKYLLCADSARPQFVSLTNRSCAPRPRPQFVTVATRSIPITDRTLDVEELGPKNLLPAAGARL